MPNSNQDEPNWVGSEPFFLAVGRLEFQKGFDLLIDAVKQLDTHNARLVILGEGNEREKLQNQIRQAGLGERVLLPGVMANPALAYQQALFYVMSSRHEGWPMVLTEAMAAGCPVVSFACNYGPGEIIEDGVSGLLVPPGDIDGLADAMDSLLRDRHLRNRLREGGCVGLRTFAWTGSRQFGWRKTPDGHCGGKQRTWEVLPGGGVHPASGYCAHHHRSPSRWG